MKLKRSVLLTVAMIGAVAAVGCNSNPAPAADTSEAADSPPDDTATADPPAPEAENPGPAPSPGEVWSEGTWKSNGGKFTWIKGHWEAKRDGTYQQPRWVKVGNKWEHHPGRWVGAGGGGRPAAPAAHPAEKPGERPGERQPEKR